MLDGQVLKVVPAMLRNAQPHNSSKCDVRFQARPCETLLTLYVADEHVQL